MEATDSPENKTDYEYRKQNCLRSDASASPDRESLYLLIVIHD